VRFPQLQNQTYHLQNQAAGSKHGHSNPHTLIEYKTRKNTIAIAATKYCNNFNAEAALLRNAAEAIIEQKLYAHKKQVAIIKEHETSSVVTEIHEPTHKWVK
jgi:hypothetical protein